MAVEREIIYMGLVRPAKVLGLPLKSAAIWVFLSALIFIWSGSFYGLIPTPLLWIVLFGLSQWDAHFFDVIAITTKYRGVAKNKRIWGGYSYEP